MLDDHPDFIEIRRHLRTNANQLVFFVGAGLSKPLGYPLWHELLVDAVTFGRSVKRLSGSEARDILALIEGARYLEAGEQLQLRLASRLNDHLKRTFSKAPPESFGPYDFLVRLPCAGFITTNYDASLESAYAKHFRKNPKLSMATDSVGLGQLPLSRPFVLKLHGDALRHNFVISSSDYKRLMADGALERFLYSVFLHYTIIFLGYGLSDEDILAPLRLLTRDYSGATGRHFALLPDTTSDELRRKLEDEAGVNVCLYEVKRSHEEVSRAIANWFLQTRSDERGLTFDDYRDSGAVLHDFPDLMDRALTGVCQNALAWLSSLPHQWGPTPTATVKAANIAEGLLASEAARRVINHQYDARSLVAMLLDFATPNGEFISQTLGAANIQTQALCLVALAKHQELGSDVVDALNRGVEWLVRQQHRSGCGWGRFSGSSIIRTVPTMWALSALIAMEKWEPILWEAAREAMLKAGTIDHVIGGSGRSTAASGWVLWILGALKAQRLTTPEDERILNLAVKILGRQESLVNEHEGFLFDAPSAGERSGMWISWIHSTAPAALLGAIAFVEEIPTLWEVVGNAVDTLLRQAREGGDGHFMDATEHPGDSPYVFHTLYSVWALCETLQVVRGVLFHKAGLIALRNRRLLLVRKRATDKLILPGGSIEPGEDAETALSRELQEELGATSSNLRFWREFEDSAAFEVNSRVRIRAFFGELDSEPRASGEIAEFEWIDTRCVAEKLSPIIRRQVLPALKSQDLVD
ncbi:MAG: SIR2 family protein [Actinomycetota bacterium]